MYAVFRLVRAHLQRWLEIPPASTLSRLQEAISSQTSALRQQTNATERLTERLASLPPRLPPKHEEEQSHEDGQRRRSNTFQQSANLIVTGLVVPVSLFIFDRQIAERERRNKLTALMEQGEAYMLATDELWCDAMTNSQTGQEKQAELDQEFRRFIVAITEYSTGQTQLTFADQEKIKDICHAYIISHNVRLSTYHALGRFEQVKGQTLSDLKEMKVRDEALSRVRQTDFIEDRLITSDDEPYLILREGFHGVKKATIAYAHAASRFYRSASAMFAIGIQATEEENNTLEKCIAFLNDDENWLYLSGGQNSNAHMCSFGEAELRMLLLANMLNLCVHAGTNFIPLDKKLVARMAPEENEEILTFNSQLGWYLLSQYYCYARLFSQREEPVVIGNGSPFYDSYYDKTLTFSYKISSFMSDLDAYVFSRLAWQNKYKMDAGKGSAKTKALYNTSHTLALKSSEDSTALNPDSGRHWINRADSLLRGGELGKALITINKILDSDPYNPNALITRAAIRLEEAYEEPDDAKRKELVQAAWEDAKKADVKPYNHAYFSDANRIKAMAAYENGYKHVAERHAEIAIRYNHYPHMEKRFTERFGKLIERHPSQQTQHTRS